MPRTLARGLAVVLTTPLLAWAGAAAPAAAADAGSRYAAQAHTATNKARAGAELPKLKRSSCLLGFARSQAEAMAAAGGLSHQDLSPVMAGCGLRAAGENVAAGFPSGRGLVNQGWMRSEGHRANIMSRTFRAEAIAAVRGADGSWYVAQVLGR